MPNASRLVAVSLAGVILGLLAVGVVSGTPVRHVIQALPATLTLGLVIGRLRWACYAALSVFACWLLIMAAIWLFLLGLARIVTGHFTPVEIALTVVIGGSCLCGLAQVFRTQPASSAAARAMGLVVFAALQVAALWLSMRPSFANF